MTTRQPYLRYWRALWPLTAFCLLVPFRYTLLKLLLLLGLLGLWGGSLYLFWDRKWVRAVCLSLLLLVGIALFLPGRPPDPTVIRREYVRSLRVYRGTLYVWGGGNRLGIDCSGLVQRGLIDADFKESIATGNPRLLRRGLSLWWHSRSARALGEGYRDETRLLFEADSLNDMDYTAILPGDIAVLSDGVHTLAYLGDRTWIEADPEPMRVVERRAPGNTDLYFNMPVRLMRWRDFEA